jgi:hypothetical protein
MTPSPDCDTPGTAGVQLQAGLAEYADRLLFSTGLHAEDALLIASGQLDAPAELDGLATALRAGWELTPEEPA